MFVWTCRARVDANNISPSSITFPPFFFSITYLSLISETKPLVSYTRKSSSSSCYLYIPETSLRPTNEQKADLISSLDPTDLFDTFVYSSSRYSFHFDKQPNLPNQNIHNGTHQESSTRRQEGFRPPHLPRHDPGKSLIYLGALVSRSLNPVFSIYITLSSLVAYAIPSPRPAVRFVQLDASGSSFAAYQSAHALFVYVARKGGVDSCHHSLRSHYLFLFLAWRCLHHHRPSSPPVYGDACITGPGPDARKWTLHRLLPHAPTPSGLPLFTSSLLTLHRLLLLPSWI